MTENKQDILNYLKATLQLTRCGQDIADLIYNDEKETVNVLFKLGGMKVINVACDSGGAMILDVVNGLL